MNAAELIPMIVGIAVAMVAIIVVPAVQAYRRGYNPFVWGLAVVFAMNPIFILVVLAMAPHRGRRRLREQYRTELDEKLAAAGHAPAAAAVPVVHPVRIDTRSVGDQVTELPRDRSIGDDQTRL